MKFRNITSNSKDVKKGDLFVAVKGERFDGHDFVREAFRRGAVAAIVENRASSTKNKKIIKVKDTRKELSRLAAGFYDYPSKKMKVIGITGTNGKTTVAYLVEKILSNAGRGVGLPVPQAMTRILLRPRFSVLG